MLSLRRVVELVRAISGLCLSEATCLGYIRRLQQALQAWEEAASAHLLAAPALHADETGLRVDRKNHWLHILTDGSLTLKFLHPKRGKAAIEAIGLIPSCRGTLVHDCWASYLSYAHCGHQFCVASITVRNLDDDIENQLRVRTASNGRSMKEEVRRILEVVVGPTAAHGTGAQNSAPWAVEDVRRR